MIHFLLPAGQPQEKKRLFPGNLAVNLAVQVVAIIAMRSIGLFYRHYDCYFSKSW
jgi:hypothetical protein